MRIGTKLVGALFILIVASLIFQAESVSAAYPYFTDLPCWPGYVVLNATQNVTYIRTVVAVDDDGDYPLNISYDKTYFPRFNMTRKNDTHALINFTPQNEDVTINLTKLVFITVLDAKEDSCQATLKFNVSNVNDPPNITGYAPSSLTPNTAENTSIGFNFTYSASDPDIPYGDFLTAYWFVDGVLTHSSNGTSGNFIYYPGYCEPRFRNITLLVNDSQGAVDSVEWNLSINNTNRQAVFNNTINNITWNEDETLVNNISLDDYFYDPDYAECGVYGDSPVFSSVLVDGIGKVTVTISSTQPHNVTFTPDANFNGNETIYFAMNDSAVGSNWSMAISNYVLLEVVAMPDEPVISSIPNQTAYTWVLFEYQVSASDPDNDPLTYDDNTTLFNITPTTGLISFTPDQDDIGIYNITINVTDGTYVVNTTMILEIRNNSAPVISPIPYLSCTQGQLCSFIATATDEDIEQLTFKENSTFFGAGATINFTSANFSFTPTQAQIGTRNVSVNVTDERGAFDYTSFILFVDDINIPPVFNETLPETKRCKVNHSCVLYVSAFDQDNDDLTYTTNSTLFNITKLSNNWAIINMTPSDSDIGNHSVLITVFDNFTTPENVSDVVVFIIVVNSPPYLNSSIGLRNATEDFEFYLDMSSFFADDDNDLLNYTDNTTLFVIGLWTGIIDFTPDNNSVGLHNITIYVTDEDSASINTSFLLNISSWNDPPVIEDVDVITQLLNNSREDNLTTVPVNASDEEGDNLTFSVEFLAGPNLYLFSITTLNSSAGRGLINFTPINSDVGNYSINLSVSDGNSNSSVIINFRVHNSNDAPQIISIKPYGTPVSNFTVFEFGDTTMFPNSTTSINLTEGITVLFGHTSSDEDNDTLAYEWALDGTAVSTNSSWTYDLGYVSAGMHNLTLTVSDSVVNASFKWVVNVTNVNRPPLFGIKRFQNQVDFINGTAVNITILSNGTLLLSENSSYYPYGSYTSDKILITDEPTLSSTNDFNYNFTTLEWAATLPAGTSITLESRVSDDGSAWDAWSYTVNLTAGGNSSFTRPHKAYIQYRLNFSTSNTNVTPQLHNLSINYELSDFSIVENTNDQSWIDLDDFFSDLDSEQLTHGVTVSDPQFLTVTIVNGTNLVQLQPSDVSSDIPVELTFNATDPYGSSVQSNTVTVTVIHVVATQQTITPGGGGATRTVIKQVIKPQRERELAGFKIITPRAVTIYENMTVIVPIEVKNNENRSLFQVRLSTYTNSTGLNLSLSKDYFEIIRTGETVETQLVINAYTARGSYEVEIRGNVTEPKLSDVALIMVNSIEKGELNRTELNTRIEFTRDLLRRNPECFELNEILERAAVEINSSNYQAAAGIIDEVIESCRNMMLPAMEKKGLIATFMERLFPNVPLRKIMRYILITVASFSILLLMIFWEKFNYLRRLQRMRKKAKK